jgi:large subunit ribosomal protein L25
METQSLVAVTRTPAGKGAARQLRMRDQVPAVLYGPGIKPTSLALSPKDLTRILSTPFGRNVVFKIEAEGEHYALVKELQIDPISRKPVHVDFYKIDVTKPIDVNVTFVTEGRAKGVVEGGELRVYYRVLPVRAVPAAIPFEIRVNVSNLGLTDAIRTKDLALPAGVEVLLDAEKKLTSVETARKLAPEEGEAGAAGATPDAAAAATPAAKPAS